MSAEDLAKFINRRIREVGLTRTETAKRAGFSRETLNKLLRAEVAQPTTATLTQLAHALRVAPLHLIRVAYGGTSIPIQTESRPKYSGDYSSFVGDVTYPDNSLVTVGERFKKVWEIQNTGSVLWENRRLVCLDGDVLSSPLAEGIFVELSKLMLIPETTEVNVPRTEPGQVARLAVTFKAPLYPCTTISYWKMIDSAGDSCFPDLKGIWCLVKIMSM